MTARPVILNGRVARRSHITGVERWTVEVFARLRALRPGLYRELGPPQAVRDSPAGQAWEQTVLPARAAAARAGAVLSPANLAPALWPRNVLVMHDAAILREPEAYSKLYRLWHGRFGLAVARRALAVVTVSEFSRRELVALAGIAADRITVAGGGVGPAFHPGAATGPVAAEARARLGLSGPYVLTVASEDRRKNLAALGTAAQRLGAEGIELVRTGDARRQFAAGGAAPDGVRSLGYVPDAELPAVIAGARAVVVPSRYEGFGLPCLEAMACGVPVVAADRGGLPEACGGAALLVDPDDRAQIAAAVLRAALEPPVRRGLIALGRDRAAAASWDRVAAAVDAVVRATVDRLPAG